MQHNNYIISCVCLPEMKKDILYNIKLTIDSSGEVLTASCGCPAGAGPKGSCKHISALCYALEEYCRIKELRSPHSCTSQLQKWNQPRKRRLESRSVEDISFVKYEYGKTKKTAQSVMYDPRPPHMRSITFFFIWTVLAAKNNTAVDHFSMKHRIVCMIIQHLRCYLRPQKC